MKYANIWAKKCQKKKLLPVDEVAGEAGENDEEDGVRDNGRKANGEWRMVSGNKIRQNG